MSITVSAIDAASAAEFYTVFNAQLAALLHGERDRVCNLAQTAAFIMQVCPCLNWAGFYLRQGDALVLGPFQGKVACTRIPLGRGVCGTAAARAATVVVPDVQAFAGHIACDSASRSELVVPLLRAGVVLGVLDLDSPEPGRFDEQDARGMEAAAAQLVAGCDWP